MADWSDWTPDVAIDVPNCPLPTIEWAVRRAVIDFCERTHWLQRTEAPVSITGGASSRSFSGLAAGELALAVLAAWIDGKEVALLGPSDVSDKWPDWKTVTGQPEAIVQERMDGYYVVPSPTATMTNALRLKLAIGYTDSTTTCDNSIRDNWRDTIASGAKARLLFQAQKPWSDPERAAVYQADYMSGVGSASLRALRTPARRPLVTRPYFF